MRSRVATRLLRERSRGELPPTPLASTSSPGPRPVSLAAYAAPLRPHPARWILVWAIVSSPPVARASTPRVPTVILADFRADRLPGYSGWIA
jgi:hypothetical protein